MTRRPPTVAASLARFGAAGLVAFILLTTLTLTIVNRVSRNEAIASAQERARLAGQGIVEPSLTNEILAQDPAAVAALDELVQTRILSERVVRVKVWAADGTVIYADEPQLVGERFRLDPDQVRALANGEIRAEISDLDRAENDYDRADGQLLEVYLPIRTPDGTPLLYEQYERLSSVVSSGRRLWVRVAPLLLGSLALLWLVQLPLAWSLTRRIRAALAERESLLTHAIVASERERERIAADLHDGVVQDLAGLSYDLAAAAATTAEPGPRAALDRGAARAREGMGRLRSALLDIHPANVHALGMRAAVDQLASTTLPESVSSTIRVDQVDDLHVDAESLVYRVVQESLRNVVKHANASHATIDVTASPRSITTRVRDDGDGFAPGTPRAAQKEGHLGLVLLESLARRQGGELLVESEPGQGTTVTLELPR